MLLKGIALTSLTCFLAACGNLGGSPETKYIPIKNLDGLEDPDGGTSPITQEDFLGTDSAPTACAYLDQLAKLPTPSLDFRLYRRIHREPKKGELTAVQNPLENPQILYALSRESNPTGKPIDPPTIEEFIELARQESRRGVVNWGKVKLLEILNLIGADAQLISLRNQVVEERIEAAMPGAITGKPTALIGSTVFTDIQKMIPELASVSLEESKSLAILTRKTPLFAAASAEARNKDLTTTLAVLSRVRSGASLDEKLCRYALSQRFTAQMLMLKGIRGAPVTAQGFLLPMAKQDVWIYPENDRGGNFGGPLSGDQLTKKLEAGESIRGRTSTGTAALMSSLRTALRVMGSHTNSEIWSADYGMNKALLELSFGLFALEMPVLPEEDLKILAQNRLSLADDSLENVTELGQLVLDGLWVAERLRTPNELISGILSPAQIALLAGDTETSLRSRLQQLFTGILLELNARSVVESGGLENLSQAQLEGLALFYERAAGQVGNALLAQRAAEIRKLLALN